MSLWLTKILDLEPNFLKVHGWSLTPCCLNFIKYAVSNFSYCCRTMYQWRI
ncbi:hypothetical protein Hanom_Chr15g01341741 [Helianthus anomalus]